MENRIEKHPYFDLWLHTTDELERILRVKIAVRQTIHDWPLSTVQKITTVDGTSIIYKVQHSANVEPEFYKSATSRLLPKYDYLGKINDCDAMTFEFIDGKRLTDYDVNEPDLVRIGRELQTEIRNIQGDLPVFTDIGDSQKWNSFSRSVLARLARLIEQGVFSHMDIFLVRELAEWADTSAIADIVNHESCFTHGDHNADNIFILQDGYRVIDWARPRYAPGDVDLVDLLLGRGFNPYPYVKREIVQLVCFLRIDWFTLCTATLIPGGSSFNERYVMDAVESLLRRKVPAKWGEL